MRLDAPFVRLPLRFPGPPLLRALALLGENAWSPLPRAGARRWAVPLVVRDGASGGRHGSGAPRVTPWLAERPVLQQVLAAFALPIASARLMRWEKGAKPVAAGHAGDGRLQIHVPIVPTAGDVELGAWAATLRSGEAWALQRELARPLRFPALRIHLVFETASPPALLALLARARDAGGVAADEREVPLRDGEPAQLLLEAGAPGAGDGDRTDRARAARPAVASAASAAGAPPPRSSPAPAPVSAARRPRAGRGRQPPASAGPPADLPAAAAAGAAFHSEYSERFPRLLEQMGCALVLSSHAAGRVLVLRARQGALNTHFRSFPAPRGVAVAPGRLAVATGSAVWEYRDVPEIGRRLAPAGQHDACFLPRTCHVTGNLGAAELAWAEDELWLASSRFSCLATLDGEHSFVPRWRPPFVSRLAPEGRCHLSGLAVADGRVRYATAFAESDAPQGWRPHAASAGCLLDVDSGEIVARGLALPCSPRWYSGRLWVLEAGRGRLATVDLADGTLTPVAELPGLARGLAFAGPYAFVGVSPPRPDPAADLPVAARVGEPVCGVWAFSLRRGEPLAFLRFGAAVPEVSDLQVLAGTSFPELTEPGTELAAGAFVLPPEA